MSEVKNREQSYNEIPISGYGKQHANAHIHGKLCLIYKLGYFVTNLNVQNYTSFCAFLLRML